MQHIPLPEVCGHRCCRAQQPEALPVPGHTGPLASPSHWPPSYPSIPQPSGVFPLPLGFIWGKAVGYCPHLQMAWEGQAAQLCNGTLSGMAGLQQFWLKKRWKIKESGRGYFWVLLLGTAKAGKGLTEQMKPVAITYKLVHYQCWTRKASYGWHLALTSYSCWVKA